MSATPLPAASSQLEREAAARVGGLFERYGRMVYGVCRAMLRDVHEAEDATQQVFLSAHTALQGGARVRDAGAWLATIARNECRRRIRVGMSSPLPVADVDLAALPAPVDEHARSVHIGELRDALRALPERQREAVVLRYLYGLRYGEVATALGFSRPATEALLFRARRALRGRLQPVAGTVLVVPLALREELALAIPGFASGSGASAAAVGAASGGILAKLTAGPLGAKAATAAVAMTTVGAVGSVESDRPVRSEQARAPIVEASTTNADEMGHGSTVVDDRSGRGDAASGEDPGDEDSSGPGAGGEPREDDRSGSWSGSGPGESQPRDASADGDPSGDKGSGESRSGEGSGSAHDATVSDPSDSESFGPSPDGNSSGSSGSGSSGSPSEGSGSSGPGSGESSSGNDS